jgi:hypothetical protein
MEQRMNKFIDTVREIKNNGSTPRDKIYLESRLKLLEKYSLIDENKFTCVVTQMCSIHQENKHVLRAAVEFLSPSDTVERDAFSVLRGEYPSILDAVSRYVVREQLDYSLVELIAEKLVESSRRNMQQCKDMTIIVSALFLGMNTFVIPGGEPKSLVAHLLSILSDTNTFVCLYTIVMLLSQK